MKKFSRRCEGCVRPVPARFRTFASAYLCAECYEAFLQTGEIPKPSPDFPEERSHDATHGTYRV